MLSLCSSHPKDVKPAPKDGPVPLSEYDSEEGEESAGEYEEEAGSPVPAHERVLC
jgi:hypothetical protein